MADGAHTRSATGASPVSGPPGGTSLANAAAPPKNTWNGASFADCAGAVCVAIIMAIVIIIVYAIVEQTRCKKPSDTEVQSFCCPGEVERMARYLNTSVDPCIDFFAYVCSSSIELNRSQITSLDFRLESAVITGAMPDNVQTAKAGRFLNSYYQSCLETMTHGGSFTTSLASALSQEVRDLLNRMDSRRAMAFIMTLSFRYYIRSIIQVTYQEAAKVILEIAAKCHPEARSLNYFSAAVDALKQTANSTATTKDTAMFVATLCEQLQGHRNERAVYYLSNGSTDFSREVWNIDEVKDAMNALGYSLDVKFIEVQGVKQIRLLYDTFNNYTSRDTKVAYLLWHSVVEVIEQFNIHPYSPKFSTQVFRTCMDSALVLYELWELFNAEILTTPRKDDHVRDIFALIKGAVHEQLKSMSLIEAEDAEKGDHFFENVNIVTPMAESRASVPVPKATKDFAENLLKGRRFDYDVMTARQLNFSLSTAPLYYRDISFLGDRYILLEPWVYHFIRTGPTSLLPNMAILGQLLAECLWAMVFDVVEWEPKTLENMQHFRNCFYDKYTKKGKISQEFKVLYASLGMSTIVFTLNWTDWETVQQAWSLWTLSHAQLFYILNSYYRCPNNKSLQKYLEISAPVMYVQDFAKAFGCPMNASVTNPAECRDLDQPRT
ncbi:uncharacterized protein [Dermacentor albipictus]|uniref:uncharacterized protein n=1 Tax=Dermacentor albipictus TaxID=60249 RepID=UPI0038FCE623